MSFVKLHGNGKYLKLTRVGGWSQANRFALVDLQDASVFHNESTHTFNLTDKAKTLFKDCMSLEAVETRTVALVEKVDKPQVFCCDPVFIGNAIHCYDATGETPIKLSKIVQVFTEKSVLKVETLNTVYIPQFSMQRFCKAFTATLKEKGML